MILNPVIGNDCATVICKDIFILTVFPVFYLSSPHLAFPVKTVFFATNFDYFIACSSSIFFYIIPYTIFYFPSCRSTDYTFGIRIQFFINPVTIFIIITCLKDTSLHLTIPGKVIVLSIYIN